MANDSPFVEEVMHRFSQVTSASVRKMFGGHGIFHNGLMFALIADNELYLKADADTKPWFIEAGLSPFSYQKADGKVFNMSYYQCSEFFFEDEDETRLWTQRAIHAANRAPPKKKKSPRKKNLKPS